MEVETIIVVGLILLLGWWWYSGTPVVSKKTPAVVPVASTVVVNGSPPGQPVQPVVQTVFQPKAQPLPNVILEAPASLLPPPVTLYTPADIKGMSNVCANTPSSAWTAANDQGRYYGLLQQWPGPKVLFPDQYALS